MPSLCLAAVEVAEALLVDEKTIRIWHEKYVHGGEDELLTLFYVGKAPLLSDIQQQELAEHLDEHTYLDSKAVAHVVSAWDTDNGIALGQLTCPIADGRFPCQLPSASDHFLVFFRHPRTEMN